MNRIDGKVEGIELKTKRYALLINDRDGRGRKYWGDQPAEYKNGEPIMTGELLVLDWEECPLDGGTVLRSIVGKPEKVDVPTKTASPEAKTAVETAFKPAGKVSDLDSSMDEFFTELSKFLEKAKNAPIVNELDAHAKVEAFKCWGARDSGRKKQEAYSKKIRGKNGSND